MKTIFMPMLGALLVLAGCSGEGAADAQNNQRLPADSENPTSRQPSSTTSNASEQMTSPEISIPELPDNLPGTDQCRPPLAKVWQLTPLQVSRSLEAIGITSIQEGDKSTLQQRLELYALEGEPYAADPTIINASSLMTSAFGSVAREASNTLLQSPEELAPCLAQSTLQRACVSTALEALALKSWRRPATSEELAALNQSYDGWAKESGEEAALKLSFRRVLSHASFLFRSELGTQSGQEPHVVLMSPYEIASFIAYTLTDGPPDELLMQAAESGELEQEEGRRKHVRRLLAEPAELESVIREKPKAPRRVVGLLRFFRDWLDVDDISQVLRPDIPKKIEVSEERTLRWLDNEVMMFVRHVLWQDDARLETILGASYGAHDSNTLTKYYGLKSRPTTPVSEAPHGRLGVLMQGGFLAAHSGATARGMFIRTRLLCLPEVEAPLEADMNLPGLKEQLEQEEGMTLSPREVRKRHLDEPGCAECHALMDPLGFPLDHFDTSGMFRETWGGFEVDSTGFIQGSKTLDGDLGDSQALVQTLSTSQEVRGCFVRQMFHYVYGRDPASSDACFVTELEDSFEASNGNIRALMEEMLTHQKAYERLDLGKHKEQK